MVLAKFKLLMVLEIGCGEENHLMVFQFFRFITLHESSVFINRGIDNTGFKTVLVYTPNIFIHFFLHKSLFNSDRVVCKIWTYNVESGIHIDIYPVGRSVRCGLKSEKNIKVVLITCEIKLENEIC